MMKKIAVFMMGIFALSGTLSLASAAGVGQLNNKIGSLGDVGSAQSIQVAGAGVDQKNNLINVVKNFINWVLGMLALITLVLLLWGGFQMVTAAGDDNKFSAGQKILKHAGIGLGFIAASWLMVSMIFWVISNIGAGASTPV